MCAELYIHVFGCKLHQRSSDIVQIVPSDWLQPAVRQLQHCAGQRCNVKTIDDTRFMTAQKLCGKPLLKVL